MYVCIYVDIVSSFLDLYMISFVLFYVLKKINLEKICKGLYCLCKIFAKARVFNALTSQKSVSFLFAKKAAIVR